MASTVSWMNRLWKTSDVTVIVGSSASAMTSSWLVGTPATTRVIKTAFDMTRHYGHNVFARTIEWYCWFFIGISIINIIIIIIITIHIKIFAAGLSQQNTNSHTCVDWHNDHGDDFDDHITLERSNNDNGDTHGDDDNGSDDYNTHYCESDLEDHVTIW